MKKVFIAVAMLLGFSGIASAQEAVAAKPTVGNVSHKVAQQKVKAQVKTDVAKPQAMAKPTAAVKADGTPDMRFKENKMKAKAKATGPTKADGTPDMRYKANKVKKG